MKICIPLRDSPPTNLWSDNLRSEGRWERQALEACTFNSEITEIYTSGYVWPSSPSPKYRGLITPAAAQGCVLLMQDWNWSIINKYNYKACIVNIFAGPWENQRGEVTQILQRSAGNLFFTLGFPVFYGTQKIEQTEKIMNWNDYIRDEEGSFPKYLHTFVPADNIICLPVPGSPGVDRTVNNFDSKHLLWATRIVFLSNLEEFDSLFWSLEKLRTDKDMKLHILTGWKIEEVIDIKAGKAIKIPGHVNSSIWELNKFKDFLDVRDQVIAYNSVDWQTVIGLYRQAKLLTAHARHFGGPPIESSMYGVPFIGTGITGALAYCPDYQYATDAASARVMLEKLYSDRDFYTKVSNSYREYTANTYTYEAFNKNLNNLLKNKGII